MQSETFKHSPFRMAFDVDPFCASYYVVVARRRVVCILLSVLVGLVGNMFRNASKRCALKGSVDSVPWVVDQAHV